MENLSHEEKVEFYRRQRLEQNAAIQKKANEDAKSEIQPPITRKKISEQVRAPRPADRDAWSERPRKMFKSSPSIVSGGVVPRSLRSELNQGSISAPEDDPATSEATEISVLPTVSSNIPPPELKMPQWYMHVKVGKFVRFDRAKLDRLMEMRELIGKYKSGKQTEWALSVLIDIREKLNILSLSEVTDVLVKKSKLLDPQVGLPQLFHMRFQGGAECPFDIKADAQALYHKWCRQEFEHDLLRGILDGKKRKGDKKARYVASLDENYPHRKSANYFGSADLQNGTWFPSQLACVRDGAHGAPQAGIHGSSEGGAYSILLSGSDYADKDEGEVIYYCGTEGTIGMPTDGTKSLLKSLTNKQPVRVLRTSKLPNTNPYRPAQGIRFDGLYHVVDKETLNKEKAHIRFHLVRNTGQDPIRYQGPGKRPSRQEIEAYNNHRRLIG